MDGYAVYHLWLSDEILNSRVEEYSLLEPCEVLIEEEWIRGGLTHWVDNLDDDEVNVIHIDGTQEEEDIMEASRLEEPLLFKTSFTELVVGRYVKDSPNMPADWYKNKDDQTHLTEEEWNYVRNTGLESALTFGARDFRIHPPMVANYVSPKWCPICGD